MLCAIAIRILLLCSSFCLNCNFQQIVFCCVLSILPLLLFRFVSFHFLFSGLYALLWARNSNSTNNFVLPRLLDNENEKLLTSITEQYMCSFNNVHIICRKVGKCCIFFLWNSTENWNEMRKKDAKTETEIVLWMIFRIAVFSLEFCQKLCSLE